MTSAVEKTEKPLNRQDNLNSQGQTPTPLTLDDFSPEFFTKMLRTHFGHDKLEVTAANSTPDSNTGSSIICELTAATFKRLIGHFPYTLDVDFGADQQARMDVMVKSKPLDTEVIQTASMVAALCGPEVALEFNKFKDDVMFSRCDKRELIVMSEKDSRFTGHAPTVFGTYMDPERKAYVIVEERLHQHDMLLMDSADDTSGWTEETFNAAIRGLSEIHSIWYDNVNEIRKEHWMSNIVDTQSMTDKVSLWRTWSNFASDQFPQYYPEKTREMIAFLIDTIPEWQPKLDAMTKTLIHNDFNPRNITFRKDGPAPKLCVYDWELATVAVPQQDLAELLAFTAFDDITEEQVNEYIELHRACLEKETGKTIDPVTWREGYQYSLYNLAVYRLAMYFMGERITPYPFMGRLYKTLPHLLAIELKGSAHTQSQQTTEG